MNNQNQRERSGENNQQLPPNSYTGSNDSFGVHQFGANVMQPGAFAPSRQYGQYPSATDTDTLAQGARTNMPDDPKQRTEGRPPTAAPKRPAPVARSASRVPPTAPRSRLSFLDPFPEHPFKMPQIPDRPLNFTLVEILVILPHFHKHPFFTERFVNNGLDSRVHIAILEAYRGVNIPEDEMYRAVAGLTDQCRKTMRSIDGNMSWSRASHKVSPNWNKYNLDVSGFVPDTDRVSSKKVQPSSPFQDLFKGLIEVIRPEDAGDLTHAILCVLAELKNGVKNNRMFPDDIHEVLNKYGHAEIMECHYDDAAVKRWHKKMLEANSAKRERNRKMSGAPSPRPTKRVKVEPKKTQQQPAQFDPRYTQHMQQQAALQHSAQMADPQFNEQFQNPYMGNAQTQYFTPPQDPPEQLQNGSAGHGQAQMQYGRQPQSSFLQMPPNPYEQAPSQHTGAFDPRLYGVQHPWMQVPSQKDTQQGGQQDLNASTAPQQRSHVSLPTTPQRLPAHTVSHQQRIEILSSPRTPDLVHGASPTPSQEQDDAIDARFLNLPDLGSGAIFDPVNPDEDPFAPSVDPRQANKDHTSDSEIDASSDVVEQAVVATPQVADAPVTTPPHYGTFDANGVFHTSYETVQNLREPSPAIKAALDYGWSRIEAKAKERGITVFQALAVPIDFSGLPTPPAIDQNKEATGGQIMLAGAPFKNDTHYPDTKLLHECAEADDLEDQSDLARAARWCRNSKDSAMVYLVGHLGYVMGLMDLFG